MYIQCNSYIYYNKYYLFFFFLQHLSKTNPRIKLKVMTNNKTANGPAMMAAAFVLLTRARSSSIMGSVNANFII